MAVGISVSLCIPYILTMAGRKARWRWHMEAAASVTLNGQVSSIVCEVRPPANCSTKSSLAHIMPAVVREVNGNENEYKKKDVRNWKEKPTAPGIPRRSPIQVLTGPDVA